MTEKVRECRTENVKFMEIAKVRIRELYNFGSTLIYLCIFRIHLFTSVLHKKSDDHSS